MKLGAFGILGGTSLVALALVLTPALAASAKDKARKDRPATSISSGFVSSFTPAVADPRLAAAFAKRGMQTGSFRFTPSAGTTDKSKAVLVTVRARGTTPETVRTSGASATAITAITPSA